MVIKNFSYSFVTVPTSRGIKKNTMPVKRTINLSGGNYWGKPSKNNVASSLKEYFRRNFESNFDNTISNHVQSNLNNNKKFFKDFLSLNF